MQGCLADEIKGKCVKNHCNSFDFTSPFREKTRLNTKINDSYRGEEVTNDNKKKNNLFYLYHRFFVILG
jgi:hypothetical protein